MRMGTNKFEEDYIEYLERINANLRNQSLRVKEFENRLINKEIRNRHCEMVMEEVKNICSSTCQAIDTFFENFTTTMDSLKTVLMWKSQVLLIPQKLAYAMNPDMNEVNHTSGSNSDSGFSSVNENGQSKNGKKCGTAKVSPMIKGHVISAPRIHLNRVTEELGPQTRRPLATTLSPIIEQSPSTSPHEAASPVFRNIRIPLRRIKIGNFAGKTAESEDTLDANTSPKINFSGRNCAGFELRRRYSSLGENERFRMMRDRRAEVVNGSKHDDEVTEDGDCINEENPSFRSEALETEEAHDKSRRNVSDDVDPLEGPSWLLNKQQVPEESEHPGLSSLQYRFVNFKRLNYARSNRVLSDENKRDVLNFNDDAQMGNFELNSNQEDVVRDDTFPLRKEASEKNSSTGNEDSSSEDSSSETEDRPEEYKNFDDSDLARPKVNPLSFRYSAVDRNSLERKSIHERDESLVLIEPQPRPRRSSGSDRLSKERNYSSGGKISLNRDLSTDCYVNLRKLPLGSDGISARETPKRWKMEPAVVVRKSEGRSSKRRSSAGTSQNPGVSDENRRSSAPRTRTKRRAAEQCIENKVWVDVTPKWEAKIKRAGRKFGKKSDSGLKKSKKGTKK